MQGLQYKPQVFYKAKGVKERKKNSDHSVKVVQSTALTFLFSRNKGELCFVKYAVLT